MSAMTTVTARSAEELVSTLFSIVDAGQWDELGTVFAEDCVYSRPGYEPLVGLARVREFYRHERIIAGGRHHVERVVSDVGAAACWGQFTGVSRSGQPLDEQFADTYQVRDGKIVFRQTYFYRAAI